tara:strand:- start:291 stop:638 length:348 start_codon:yes stop_codon:yes gene_type:complete
MEYSLEHIHHSHLKTFLKKLALVGSRASPDYSPKTKHPNKHSTEKDLKETIHNLKQELQKTTLERDQEAKENKTKIAELNVTLLSIKTKMHEVIEHKKQRQKRIDELEQKIKNQA